MSKKIRGKSRYDDFDFDDMREFRREKYDEILEDVKRRVGRKKYRKRSRVDKELELIRSIELNDDLSNWEDIETDSDDFDEEE